MLSNGEALLLVSGEVDFEGEDDEDDFGHLADDVYRSLDGTNWSVVNEAPEFEERDGAKGVYFNGYYWLAGGDGEENLLNDVWKSEDGITWEEVTVSADFAPRVFFGLTVFDNKMWVIGGEGDDGDLADVWNSTDGITWTEVQPVGDGFPVRSYFNVATFDNKMWIVGGYQNDPDEGFSDTWYSSDGATWTEVTPIGELWSARSGPCVIVSSYHMFIVGGYDEAHNQGLESVFYSSDGVTWTEHFPLGE